MVYITGTEFCYFSNGISFSVIVMELHYANVKLVM